MMNVCVLCDGRESGDVVVVERGIDRIRYASNLKNDGVNGKLDALVKASEKVIVHAACRKTYTSHLKVLSVSHFSSTNLT